MPAPFVFSQRSLDNIKGVHPDLVRVLNNALAITDVDFGIIEGLRTKERQQQMVNEGKSQTLKSRHIGGFAVDFAAYIGGVLTWEEKYYHEIARALKTSSWGFDIPIVWGGDWKTLVDMDHVELDSHRYPDPTEPLVA